jgi:uncharacterized protein YgiB involved in biofilm formation
MKRSKLTTASLALLGITSTGFLGCDEVNDEPTEVATAAGSIQDCVKAGIDQTVCADAWAKAAAENAKTAPRYATAGDCYSEFGAGGCQQIHTSNGNSVFIPLMTGMLIGNLMADRRDNYNNHHVVVVHNYQPLYRTGGSWHTSTNQSFSGSGKVVIPHSYTAPKPISTTTLSRGGFGSMGAARSSWGGGFGRSGGFGG